MYIFFSAEKPTFIESPQDLKIAEESTAVLKCRVFGAPKPTLVWQKGVNQVDVQDLDERERFTVLDNGNLEITVRENKIIIYLSVKLVKSCCNRMCANCILSAMHD